MSTTRSRSGSTAKRPAAELLSPSPAGDTRNSTTSTQGTLSIASYYYNNAFGESYDFTTDPNPSQPPSPAWPPTADTISGSPRGRVLSEITGSTSHLHRRTSSSVHPIPRHQTSSQSEAPPSDFSGWASGFHFGNNREVGSSSDAARRTSASLDPFAYSEDTPPQITLSHFSDQYRVYHEVLQKNQHSRDTSSVSEGDVGRLQQYANMASAMDSSASLQMAFDTQPQIAESLPGTPLGTSMQLMDPPLTSGGDESEGAFLTSNQNAGSGWDRYGMMARIMDSPEDDDTEQEQASYFHKRANGQDVASGSSPLRSVIGLEDGYAHEERQRDGSSADRYAQLGVSEAPSLARKGLDRINKSMRRISRRVVNLDGQNRDRTGATHIRLPDVDDDDSSEGEEVIAVTTDKEPPIPITPYGLRGKSLGIFGPDNVIRKAFARLMSQVWMEPLILVGIIFNVVLVIIQSAPSVYTHPRQSVFLQGWVDYALLAVFGFFTVEVVGRIIVSGLFINPPPLYEATSKEQPHEVGEVESDIASLPSLGHQRRKASRSNTLDTMAVLGESIKSRANDALRPVTAQNRAGHNSPNRAHPPRTVTSDFLTKDGDAAALGGQKRILNAVSSRFLNVTPFAKAIVHQRAQAADYAYLRHSWNRIDFVAVISFWIMFLLCISGQEMTQAHHIYIFRAMSVLRAARLLTITSGTSTILHSLKTAGPLLVNVAFFTLFSMLLFSIIGIQAFKGSYRRSCIYVGDMNPDVPGMAGQNFSLGQLCGGYFSPSGEKVGAVNEMGFSIVSESAKGFICPVGQICVETNENPYSDTESFDDIFHSLLQVIIVISINGWSTIMYNMIDADYFSSFLYFVFGVLIMNFWLANLFVAVVINTFACITAETKQSAFTARKMDATVLNGHVAEASAAGQRRQRVANVYKRFWGYTKFFWLALVVADLGVQASQASHRANIDNLRLSTTELYITIAFDVEILLRFFSYLLDNDWRSFFTKKRNLFDLFLAILTSITQIPVIRDSPVYAWMTVFQLARFYRVIVAVPRMEALLSRVFGSLAGLMNMILFLLLIVGLATLIAVQIFRGDIPQEDNGVENEINFKSIYNSYLGMYQLFSSENWTTVLYSALSNQGQYRQAVIGAIFLCGWFLFANFIVLQMFIAVITENFGVLESQKKAQQLEKYLRKLEKPEPSFPVRILSHMSPYRWLRERNQAIMEGSSGKSEKPNLAQRAVDNLDEKNKKRRSLHHLVSPKRAQSGLDFLRKILRLDRPEEQVPLDTLQARQFRQSFSGANMLNSHINSVHDPAGSPDATARLFARDRQLSRMRSTLGLSTDDAPLQSVVDAEHTNRYVNDPRIAQARMINTHPSYEKSLWIFSNTSAFRRTCQSFVPPSYGERLFGRQTNRIRKLVYQWLIFGAIAASVVVAGVATPSYRREWYGDYGFRRDSWFSLTEITLSVFFLAEFLVKVIADGFAFTPNAYLMSPWNALDLFVLATLVVNVSTELAVIGGVNRFTRALKALRALRLINLSDLLRRAFSALIAGAGRFVDVSVLAILYIVPFAVWGQNLFSGLLFSCTDTSGAISTKIDCVGEYSASPSQWTFLAPRAWINPTQGSVYSFDDFKSSLLILFEIVSLEGWINVMTTAMSITGRNQQLQTDARQINALFFVIYNLIGAIFVLTLFVAVIIENFQEFSGAAYLTTAQRQWIDLKRLIARQRPSKRPKVRPIDPFRSWCYNRAVQKTGWWSRFMTFLYIGSLVTLATQRYSDPPYVERIRDIVYVSITFIFVLDIIFRLAGLGWKAYRSDWWNLFDLFVVTGTLATTMPLLDPDGTINNVNIQLQKIFLTAVAFKLVQRSNALNQLFKTAVSSLPSIASLFLLWLVMFLVWGIMLVEVFGLTAWGPNETYSKNFKTLGNALVFLSLMSTGEGWNQYMHDFTLSPPLCTASSNYLATDCGSETWAYLLFISWNVMSMYIFLNMFTGTVVENFSYVFQMGGKPKLSREQVRNFKQAWSLHDKNRLGYMPKKELVGFFNELGGSMELKMHPGDASIKSLKSKMLTMPMSNSSRAASTNSPTKGKFTRNKGGETSLEKGHFMWPPSPLNSPVEILVDGLNISQLNKQLSSLDYADIQRRKRRFEHIYYEACILAERPSNAVKGGISFHEMLLLVAHYKLINDEEALCLEELMDRRELQEKVEDRIQTEKVRGMLRLVWLRRRFLALKAEKIRMSAEWHQSQHQHQYQHHQHNYDVPIINIDDSAAYRASKEITASSSRIKPKLTLNMDGMGPSTTVDSEPRTPPPRNSNQYNAVYSTQHLSPHRPIRSMNNTSPISAGGSGSGSGSDEEGGLRVRLSPSEDGLSPDGSTSPSPSLREVERRASNAIESIDASAWGTLARRLSSDTGPREDQQHNLDTRGDYGRPIHPRQNSQSSHGGASAGSKWL